MNNVSRILLISLKFAPIIGGAEIQAEKQARQLQALGHDVQIITLRLDKRWQKNENLDGLPVRRLGGVYVSNGRLSFGRLGHFLTDIELLWTLWYLRHTYDAIHVFQLSSLAAVAALVGEWTNKPVVISIASAGPDEAQLQKLQEGGLLLQAATNRNVTKVALPIVGGDIEYFPQVAYGAKTMLHFLRTSHAFYQVLSSRSQGHLIHHGFRATQIKCIPNGVDITKFQPTAKFQHDAEKQERDIVCVARLEYAKGIDILLHAWKGVMQYVHEGEQCIQPRLLLLGDGVLKAELESIADDLELQDSVVFLGKHTNVVDFLQHAWGLVLPSRWEGMPNALLEGMACGLPCVATRVSGSEEIITQEVNGLLVEPEQTEEMALALYRILTDSKFAQRLGHEGRATIVQHYQLSHIVTQCLELYQNNTVKEQVHIPFVLERVKRER